MKISGFDWDNGNWPKCGKHGVSREEIEQLFMGDTVQVAPDVKHSTTLETRYLAVGVVNERALFVAFAIRGKFIRPISARYMHEKEARGYFKQRGKADEESH